MRGGDAGPVMSSPGGSMLVFKVRGVVEASESRLDCFWPMVLWS